MILVRKSDEQLIIHDPKGKGPRMLVMGWPEQLALLLVLVVASLWLWYGLLALAFRSAFVPAVRVPHAQQVGSYDTDIPLQVGDTIFIAGKLAPIAGKVAALPLQSVRGHDANGPEQLVILGVDQYYIVAADGSGKVFTRTAIRGIVQNQV